jgi:cold shock CspA family protein
MKKHFQDFTQLFENFFSGKNQVLANPPPAAPAPARFVLPKAAEQAVRKALQDFVVMDRNYNLQIWSTLETFEQHVWDLAVGLAHNDLEKIRLELLDKNQTVFSYREIGFDGSGTAYKCNGNGGTGVEVQFVPRSEVGGHRFLVYWKGIQKDRYRHLLKIAWTPCAELQKQKGAEFETSHSKNTAGTQSGKVFVSDKARYTLIVTRSIGEKGFGFADAPDLKLSGVFLHVRQLHGANEIRVGQRLSALLVQTLNGVQARDIRVVTV